MDEARGRGRGDGVSAVRVSVTAQQIADAPDLHNHWDHPVRDALARLTGQSVDIDGDGQDGYIATIGQDVWTIVIGPLPAAVKDFLDYRWENGGAGEPFDFDLEVPAWVVVLVAKAASVLEQGDAVMRADGLA